jgi:hypothetical protein
MSTFTERRTPRRLSLALPIAGALLAVTAGASLAQSPSTGALGAIDHPTGPTDIVLSLETGGGFVPFGYFMTQAPTFVLYGDNTVIFRPSVDPEGTGFPPFIKATLSPEQVDALLTYALSVGHLADADAQYLEMTVSDAPTTVFTINAGGVTKSVSVYALDMGDHTGPDAAMYGAFQDLAALLSTFETQVEKGQVLTAEVYQPETYRAVLSPGDLAQADLIDWPFADLTVDDFQPLTDNPSFLLGALTAEQLAAVTTVPSGGNPGIGVRSPDGSAAYLLQWRPLLPGEELQPTVLGGKGF